MGETQICFRQERSDLDTRTDQMYFEVRKVFKNSRSTVGFSRWIRTSSMYWMIQNSNSMTFGEMVRSRVLVLATKEDDFCLGKRNRGKMGRKIVGTI